MKKSATSMSKVRELGLDFKCLKDLTNVLSQARNWAKALMPLSTKDT